MATWTSLGKGPSQPAWWERWACSWTRPTTRRRNNKADVYSHPPTAPSTAPASAQLIFTKPRRQITSPSHFTAEETWVLSYVAGPVATAAGHSPPGDTVRLEA